MKTIYTILPLILLFTVGTMICYGQENSKKFVLDRNKSYIKWIATDQDEKFTGIFKVKEGYIQTQNGNPEQMVVFADIQSFECQKCGASEIAQKISEYVRSEDFFDSRNMSFATFKMSKWEPLENSKNGNFTIEGMLTVKGYSNEIYFPANIEIDKNDIEADAGFSMNRMLWKLPNPSGGNEVYTMENTVDLVIHLEGEFKK